MHDLDRAMFEAGLGGEQEYGYESAELEQEEFLNVLGEVLGQSNGASPQAARGMPERRTAAAPSRSSAQDETEEMELALELLQVSNEEEFESWFNRLTEGASKFFQSPTGKATKDVLMGGLKAGAGALLSGTAGAVGGALGRRFFPGTPEQPKPTGPVFPGEERGKSVGAAVGGALPALFGFELEGLSQEDREFEAARALVNWAQDTTKRAAAMTPQATARPSAASGATRQVPPAQIAKAAAVAAAQRVAPGLAAVVRQMPVPASAAGGPGAPEQSGRWTRRGNTVVLHGF